MDTMNTAEKAGTASTAIPGFVTIEQAAKILGKTPGSLYMKLRRGPYRVVRAGRTILLPNETMLALFANLQEME